MIAKLERTYNNVQQNMKQTQRKQNSATNQQQQNHRLKGQTLPFLVWKSNIVRTSV